MGGLARLTARMNSRSEKKIAQNDTKICRRKRESENESIAVHDTEQKDVFACLLKQDSR